MVVTDALLGLAGGVLIGLACTAWLFLEGRIAGVSGLVGATLEPRQKGVREGVALLAGLVVGGVLLCAIVPGRVALDAGRSPATLAAAGLLVGFGTQLGSGCTSGHGVCGLGRRSPRSLVAVMVFMVVAAATVALVRVA